MRGAGAPAAGVRAPRPQPGAVPGDKSGVATTPAALPSNPPIAVSQQMMEALDKYARLQEQRGNKDARGAQLDVSQ
jgi:hypothetical protein